MPTPAAATMPAAAIPPAAAVPPTTAAAVPPTTATAVPAATVLGLGNRRYEGQGADCSRQQCGADGVSRKEPNVSHDGKLQGRVQIWVAVAAALSHDIVSAGPGTFRVARGFRFG
jgi:hypothetical protein